MAEALLESEMEGVVEAALNRALKGFPDGLKLVLDRLVPVRRERPVQIDLAPVETAADAAEATADITARVASGELTPREGKMIAALLESRVKLVQAAELERRVDELEHAVRFLRVALTPVDAPPPEAQPRP